MGEPKAERQSSTVMSAAMPTAIGEDQSQQTPATEQAVISVTIVEKKTPVEQKKLRKTEAPSKLIKQPSQSSFAPFAQSLAGKLNHLDAMGIHEKVKVDAEIKSRVNKTYQKAKVLESLTKFKLGGQETGTEVCGMHFFNIQYERSGQKKIVH